jgi:hypothetical protein
MTNAKFLLPFFTLLCSCICDSGTCQSNSTQVLLELPSASQGGDASLAYVGTFEVTYAGDRGSFVVSFSTLVDENGERILSEVVKDPEQSALDVGLEIRNFPGRGDGTAVFALFGLVEEREGINAYVAPERIEVRVWNEVSVLHDETIQIQPTIEEVRADPGEGQLCRYCEGSYTTLPLE